MENSNPIIYFKPVDEDTIEEIDISTLFYGESRQLNNKISEITENDVYECIKDIIDPEYPLTLEQLNVVSLENIIIDHKEQIIFVFFKPTVTSCSQASLIGLSIYYKLYTVFNRNFKIIIKVVKGTHDLEDLINKQLKDKERVYAALENPQIYKTITKGLANSDIWEDQSLLY
ncbi:uncharacterized protein cubi_03179 [Cryptosporidium ubiquitum]|uniref:MIP18 family-like domain-containing protein n=1 Tax=Cryptosporidium ubiquitum TaxID=857276 RepID=A0A1J4MNY3_9CRYT|nr:uncharacterized protein cubi_03179 [Cryptosporidium ubiquitum]OII75163.1 hypothetical protein cubi_03179 [Cryptosporidium ubiquitum]